MTIHQSSVNFKNLIKDLADMYPYDVAEIVIVELIANSLDAKSKNINITYDGSQKILSISDDGNGMGEKQFQEYHDFAAGIKIKGTGIGFAGVGAKISFNIANKVITETISNEFKGASNWYWETEKKLIWEDKRNEHLAKKGTLVKIYFNKNSDIPYKKTEDIIQILYRHYLPLFDKTFLELYDALGIYSKKLSFWVNGKVCNRVDIESELKLGKVKKFFLERKGKKYGYGFFGIASNECPLPTAPGVILSTYGKVVKSEFFNYYLTDLSAKIFGIVEIPELVKFLTTSKTDFVSRGNQKELESLIDPVRNQFKIWLKEEFGIENVIVEKKDDVRKIEKLLSKIIDEVPELKDFWGAINRKTVIKEINDGQISVSSSDASFPSYPDNATDGIAANPQTIVDVGDSEGKSSIEDNNGFKKGKPIARKSKTGPKIAFIEMPDRDEISWVEGDKIFINIGSPSYNRIKNNSQAKIVYFLFSIASAFQKFKNKDVEEADIGFIDKLILVWGKYEG